MLRRASVGRRLALVMPLLAGACHIGDATGPSRVRIDWSVPVRSGAAHWTGTPGVAGDLVIVQDDNALLAMSSETGRVAWRTVLRASTPVNARNIAVAGGRAFTAGGDSLYAVDQRTGRRLWAFLPDAQAATCEIAADENLVVIGTRSHRVYALDAATGAVQWSINVGPGWTNGGLVFGVSLTGDAVYVGAVENLTAGAGLRRGHVLALHRDDGAILWHYEAAGDQNDVSAAPRVAGDLVLVSDLYGGSVYALRRATGVLAWRVAMSGLGPTGAPIVRGDTAFVGANDAMLYAIDPSDGRVLWQRDTGGSIMAIADCGGVLLANNTELPVYSASGERLATFFAEGDDFLWSGFGVAGRRAVVVGNQAVYGLECPSL